MLMTPPTAARTKVTEFLIDGPAYNALVTLDGHIDRTKKDVDDGAYRYGRNTSLNKRFDPNDSDDDSDGRTDRQTNRKLAPTAKRGCGKYGRTRYFNAGG